MVATNPFSHTRALPVKLTNTVPLLLHQLLPFIFCFIIRLQRGLTPDQPLFFWANNDSTNPSGYKQVLMLTSCPWLAKLPWEPEVRSAQPSHYRHCWSGMPSAWDTQRIEVAGCDLCLVLNAEQEFRVVAQPVVQELQEQLSEVFIAKIQSAFELQWWQDCRSSKTEHITGEFQSLFLSDLCNKELQVYSWKEGANLVKGIRLINPTHYENILWFLIAIKPLKGSNFSGFNSEDFFCLQ